jgi:hypothetical protein
MNGGCFVLHNCHNTPLLLFLVWVLQFGLGPAGDPAHKLMELRGWLTGKSCLLGRQGILRFFKVGAGEFALDLSSKRTYDQRLIFCILQLSLIVYTSRDKNPSLGSFAASILIR